MSAPDLLRLTTAGSVDDGKSTLIGRLLHDCGGVFEDQMASAVLASKARAQEDAAFAFLLDGLRAEREQGITIDVAYRHFSTPRRRFNLADTPGHEQYTRNMATGASTADLAVILVDASRGFTTQSRRHTYIANLLGIPRLVLAVNKMDLVEFRRDVFESIAAEFAEFAGRLGVEGTHAIPVSALRGDNVVHASPRLSWFQGETLLAYLETVPLAPRSNQAGLRFPVQYVIRASPDFRGYAGQVASGTLRKGDPVVVLPSGRPTRVRALSTYDGEREQAEAGSSVTVLLEDEIDISRGDMIVGTEHPPTVSRHIEASLVWMAEQPLDPRRTYLLKHTTQQVYATLGRVRYKVQVDSLDHLPAETLALNEIGAVSVETYRPLFMDPYRRSRSTGSFILIDPASNATVAAGMVSDEPVTGERTEASPEPPPFTLWLTGRRPLANLLENRLTQRGRRMDVLGDEVSRFLPELAQVLKDAARNTVCAPTAAAAEAKERTRSLVGEECFVDLDARALSSDDSLAVAQVLDLLEREQRAPAAPEPAARQRGVTVWFTGLSGAGKTTISRLVEQQLRALGCRVEVLDGDELRHTLGKGLLFSKEDRDENIRRIGYVAGLLTRNEVIVLVSVISPYRLVRDQVRRDVGHFAEIFVNTPLQVCEQRDVKGLYKKARAGLIRQFTGIDDPYEEPLSPEVECRTETESVEQCAGKILAWLRRNDYLA